jgi:hypothetical protein
MENRRLNTAIKMAVRQRNYQRVRARALARLSQAHPDEYRKLFEQEKLNDHTQGKTWLDLDSNANATLDPNTRTDTSKSGDTSEQTGNATRTGNV